MFQIDDRTLQGPWHLSQPEEKEIQISEDLMKYVGNHDLLAINFLYQNYRKNYKGGILNEQNGFNMQLQVAMFLHVMFRSIEQRFLSLVIAPDFLIGKWFQYLTEIAGLKTVTVNSETCPEDFDDAHGVALLTSFGDINLTEHLIGYNFFAVVIDCFDEVAKKPIVRKLDGDFHIGLTTRNFYFSPDQRLQWMMLNWCSPGCCGESKNFCQIDNDNFANFRDNYRHWWFRLSRHFCESFQAIVDEEKVSEVNVDKKIKRKTSRKNPTSNTKRNKKTVKLSLTTQNTMESGFPVDNQVKTEPLDHSDTIISKTNETGIKQELQTEAKPFEKNLSKMDDDNDPLSLLLSGPNTDVNQFREINRLESEQSAQIKAKDECISNDKNDILLSLIGTSSPKDTEQMFDPVNEVSIKKEEITSQIFSDFVPNSQKVESKSDSNDFLLSLLG